MDSIATERIPHCCSQSANAFKSRVNVGKLRIGCGSRSALTATNNSLAPTSMPAACGCKIGNSSHRFFDLFTIGSSELPVGCPKCESKTNSQSRSSSETTNVITRLYANPGPTLHRRASIASTNVGAGCSCHPTDAQHHRSPHVPFHPVWPAPVARFPLLIAFKRAAHRGAAFHAQVHGRASRIRKNKEDRKQRKPLDSKPGSKAQHGVKPSSTLAGFSAQRWSRKGPDAPYSPH